MTPEPVAIQIPTAQWMQTPQEWGRCTHQPGNLNPECFASFKSHQMHQGWTIGLIDFRHFDSKGMSEALEIGPLNKAAGETKAHMAARGMQSPPAIHRRPEARGTQSAQVTLWGRVAPTRPLGSHPGPAAWSQTKRPPSILAGHRGRAGCCWDPRFPLAGMGLCLQMFLTLSLCVHQLNRGGFVHQKPAKVSA